MDYDTWCEINNEKLLEKQYAQENMDSIHWCWNCQHGECDVHIKMYKLDCGHSLKHVDAVYCAKTPFEDTCIVCDLPYSNREIYYLICGSPNETIEEFYYKQELKIRESSLLDGTQEENN